MNGTAKEAVGIIRKRTPKAFGDLQNSIHAIPGDNPKVVVDAPHAAAVEIGSAPHMPDIERLIAWVKLRGMQALTRPRNLHNMGVTTREQAVRVKDLLRNETRRNAKARGLGPGRGAYSPTDAAARVAHAIAMGIEKYGTKPHFFVRSSLPEISTALGRRLRK